MKKIVIPAILAATILVAGMFALMPVEKAASVHTTIVAQTGQTFRVAAGPTALGTSDAGNEVFSITCAAACIVDSIEIWTTAGDEDLDIIHVANIAGQVATLTADLAAPTNNAEGDIARGTTNPGLVIDAINTVKGLAAASEAESLPDILSTPAAGTVRVELDNPTDADGDRAVNVIFSGRILSTTAPTVAFTNN